MFSKTCEYAIRALIFIAHKSKGGLKTGIKEISAGIDSPAHFIAKILQDLSRRGLVQSMKGPTGGFYLDETCLAFSLADSRAPRPPIRPPVRRVRRTVPCPSRRKSPSNSTANGCCR